MNYIYFVAVIGNRLVALACVLALSYLLTSHEFGVYAVTAANALVIQILLSSWLSSSANRLLALPDRNAGVNLSTIALGMGAVAIILALAALSYTLMPFLSAAPLQVVLMLGWSATIMLYDVTQASQNALGEVNGYALLAMVRNVLALIASVVLVLIGYGPTGAIAGQLVGNVLPILLLPASRRIWRDVQPTLVSLPTLRHCLAFGTAGTFALGQYMLISTASRNLVALTLGGAAAGQWALAFDVFYGPLGLLGSAYSLSNMRRLYASHGRQTEDERQSEMGKFLLVILYFAIPYAVGGYLLAPRLAPLLFSKQSLPGILLIASAATVQSAAMLALFGLNGVLLAINRRVFLIASVVSATLLVSGATLVAWAADGRLNVLMWAATLALTIAVVTLTGYAMVRRYIALDMIAVGRISIAAAVMGVVIAGLQAIGPEKLFLPLIAGTACYGILTIQLRLIDLRDFIPTDSPLTRKLRFLR